LHSQAPHFLGERLQDLALRGTALEWGSREPLGLAPAKLRVRRMPRGAKIEAPRAPATLLDARDGNPSLAPSRDEHCHVQDPVLLRAEQLLAVVEKDVRVKRVRNR
jgi:hypothetical protein